jgi:hypothetical protein
VQKQNVPVITDVRRRPRALGVVVGLVLACFVVYVWGGYVEHWSWTGLSRGVVLWDWLEALALPVSVALVPVFVVNRERLHRRHKRLGLALLIGFVVLVLAGYLVPWTWTGFVGNTAWDWIQLLMLPVLVPILVLPLVVEGTESWMERQHPEKESASQP